MATSYEKNKASILKWREANKEKYETYAKKKRVEYSENEEKRAKYNMASKRYYYKKHKPYMIIAEEMRNILL